MTRVCLVCGKNIAEAPGNLDFIYKGFNFEIFKDDKTCPECAKRNFIEKFGYLLEDNIYVRLEKNKIKVNWFIYVLFVLDSIRKDLNFILLSLGVFSLEKEDNFEIVKHNVLIIEKERAYKPSPPRFYPKDWFNPKFNGKNLYFTREEDADSFKKIRWREVISGLAIAHYRN
jgi:hypothetical protein